MTKHYDSPDFAAFAREPDPDWDGGELDLEAERPSAPAKREPRPHKRSWTQVGFGVVMVLAAAELGIMVLAAPVVGPEQALTPEDSVDVEFEQPGMVPIERAPLPTLDADAAPTADESVEVATLASVEPASILAAGVASMQIHRPPPPPVFDSAEAMEPGPATMSPVAVDESPGDRPRFVEGSPPAGPAGPELEQPEASGTPLVEPAAPKPVDDGSTEALALADTEGGRPPALPGLEGSSGSESPNPLRYDELPE